MTHRQQLSCLSYRLRSLAFLLALACASPVRDLGDTADQRTEDVAQAPAALVPVADFVWDFEGVWLGEAEDPLAADGRDGYRFPSGSTRFLLDYRNPSEATLTFGEGPRLAPPTDPDVGYPPNAEDYLIESAPLQPWEGHPYPVWGAGTHARNLLAVSPEDYFDPARGWFERERRLAEEGRVVDGLLSLQYDVEDLFRPWCELQGPDSYCNREELARNGASLNVFYERHACGHPVTNEPMDCGKAYLCYFHCPLFADNAQPRVISQLDLRLSADGLVGVFSQASFVNERGFLTPIGEVHFRRVE